MKVTHLRVLIPLLVFFLVPCSSRAQVADMVVAADGAIHLLRQGPYSALFPNGYEAEPTSSVLALDVMYRGHAERFLVPTTEDPYAERPATLHYERNSETTYVLWEGLVNGLHPFLHLAGFDGQTWSDPIDITGNVFADKASAELVILSEPEISGESPLLTSRINRSIIYVAWQEISSAGPRKYLVPIILQDGFYLGWHESLQLSRLLSQEPAVGGQRSRHAVDANVENLLRIQPSTKDSALVVGFTNPDTGRVVTLEVEVLPQALSALAARVESLITSYADASNSVTELADKVRGALTEYTGDFHRSTLDYLADQIEELLLEHSTVAAARAPGIPEKIGVSVVHIGARVRSKGLIDSEPRDIIQMGQTQEGGAPYHHLKISVLVDREAPEVGGPAVLFLSSTGLEALVAWEVEDAIVFRESEGNLWDDPQTVEFGENLDKKMIYRILADRTLNR